MEPNSCPGFPHAVQTVQGVGESLRQSQNDDPATRTLKAVGTGAITAAGSLVAGGGIAGEIGKRLTNQITRGPVRTATDYGVSVLKQGLLSATQNAAGATSDKLAEGNLPDMNEVSKLAVKGAVDGTLTGTALHHAVVPTEGKSGKMVEAAGNGNPNAHTLPRHGKNTKREDQRNRANTGKTPDGSVDKKLRDASKWLRNVDNSDGIAVAKRRWDEMKQKGIINENEITVKFDNNIGEGYLKGSDNLIKTKEAIFRFNSKGELITSYPKIRD